ncbi:hypothetical protein EGW08_023233 [Elysia chlorotica]|uniref:NTF2 domain-containing protein n=1 Tax=Elysia chlorotica TaxID=188477 RepID=A0A433SIY5_ELYCH|nr:hypothetical protein EGW08_023233 [Elysia chlorotica]
MSYNNRSDNFSVTAGRDGSRLFKGDHDYRFNQGSNRGYRGRSIGGSRGNRRANYRNINASSSRYGNRFERNEDAEGDISMSGDSSKRSVHNRGSYGSSRGRYNSRGRGSRRPTTTAARYNKRPSDAWFKIMVPFGSRLSQKDLYSMITSNIDGPFDPVQYSTDDKRAFFYVKGVDAADNIRSISRRITKPDGHKLIFHVSPANVQPDQSLSDTVIEKLKLRMSDRYDPATQLLNLSSLYTDEVLSKEGINLPLSRFSTMSAITKIIVEHIPELSGLDVSNNRLTHLGNLSELVKGTPNVASLNLGQNQLRALEELEKIKGWANLAELVLDGNDACSSYTNQANYASAVRKIFPKVVRLDGIELPPPITFDLDTDVKLPESKGSYFFNDDIKNLVVAFIKDFYAIYDSDRRRDLMPAYHENAQFSLSCSKNPMFEKQIGFSSYIEGSRNLKRIGHLDQEKLAKKIHTGNLHVIAFLEKLPLTTHDIHSFKVDVSLASPTLLSFVLHGVFKENESRSDKLIRAFSRSFVTVPCGNGMVIINDMLTLSNAGYELTKNAFKSGAPTPSSSPVPPTASRTVPPDVAPGAPTPFLTPEQIQMVEKFTKDSRMNNKFSLKCLQENAWDYQRAGQVFTNLHNEGKIPPEAFVKDAA